MSDFGFVTHPLTVADIRDHYPLARHLPPSWVEAACRTVLPIRTVRLTGIRSRFGATDGWLVTCVLTSRQMEMLPRRFVADRIARATLIAQRLGAGVVGLGGIASTIGAECPRIGDMLSVAPRSTSAKRLRVAITTGENYNAAVTLDAARMASGLIGKTLPFAEVTVVGGERPAGAALARLLAREACGLTLVAENPVSMRHLSAVIARETGLVPRISGDMGRAIHCADIVLFDGGGRVDPDAARPGAVFCRIGAPYGISRDMSDTRKDVLVIEGGLVEIPGDVRCAAGQFDPRSCDPRLAEAMIMAMEGKSEGSGAGIGVNIERVDEMSGLATRHGFRLAGLMGPGGMVTGAQIAEVKRAAGPP